MQNVVTDNSRTFKVFKLTQDELNQLFFFFQIFNDGGRISISIPSKNPVVITVLLTGSRS